MDVLDNSGNPASENRLTTSAKSDLKSTYPWVNFIAITGYIVSALYILFMIYVVVMINVPGAGIALLFYGVFAGLYCYISFQLHKYGRGIKSYVLHGISEELDEAFASQKKFWLIAGIMLIIGLVFMVIGVISMMAALAANPSMFEF